MSEVQPKRQRIQKIVTMTGRSLLVIFVIVTSLQALFIFRNLSGQSNNVEENPPEKNNINLVSEASLLGGYWVFSGQDDLMKTGQTNRDGLNKIIAGYQEKYVETRQDPVDEFSNLSVPLKLLEIVGNRANKPAKIINRTFVDPLKKNRIYLVLGAEISPDNIWYFTTDYQDEKRISADADDSGLSMYIPQWRTIAKKMDQTGKVVLLWSSDQDQSDFQKNNILSHWESLGIQYDHNFSEYPERFDYTCKLDDSTVRVLGMCEGETVTDLIVLRQ